MFPVASLVNQNDIRKHLTEVLRVSTDEGFEGKIIFNTSGYFVKVIAYYNNGKSKLFPDVKVCYPPSQAKESVLEKWNSVWQFVGGIKEEVNTGELYLEVLEELGLSMSLGLSVPFDDAAEGAEHLFCFTDGVSGLFFFLGFAEELKYTEEDEIG